jgi:hypothetical protein
MVENTLTIIHVDTASSGGTYVNQHGQTVTQHELSIAGLVDPQGFKADVWSMIRGDGVGGVYASQKMERAPAAPVKRSLVEFLSMGNFRLRYPTSPPLVSRHRSWRQLARWGWQKVKVIAIYSNQTRSCPLTTLRGALRREPTRF